MDLELQKDFANCILSLSNTDIKYQIKINNICVDFDGVIQCPLHSLKFDAVTKKLLKVQSSERSY